MMFALRQACFTAVVLLVALGAALPETGVAQEQFFTQSGGKGLQNAKTNARLTKAETEIGVMQDDLRTIKPHARAELGNCSADGEKLRYDGTNWVCDKETDPTVQEFAKKALPSCSAGTMLGVQGGELGCSTVGFVTQETDPTVQEFAKQPLPQCASEQLIAVGANNTLRCITDQQGITAETDPKVYEFARKDVVGALPNCPVGELLTMVNGRLGCRVDQVGLSVEVDPQVQDFARKDNGEPALAACAAGEVLRSSTVNGKIILVCENASGSLTETLALNDLTDVTTAGQSSGTTLTYSNGQWRAIPGIGSAANPLYLNQLGDTQISSPVSDEVLRWDGTRWVNSDDKLGTLTDTNWCRTVGTEIVCDRPPPLTCSAGEILSWDGTTSTWLCTNAASAIGGAIRLDDLGDVTITTVVTGQVVRFDGTGWVNSTIERILAADTQIVATDTGTDGLLSFATDGTTRMAITNQGRVGIGVMPASPYMLDVSGSIRASGDISATDFYGRNGFFGGNLTVAGNLNISGSQSIDGVLFANGGIAMSGTVASGNVSVTNLSATVADIRTLRVTNNQTVGGGISATGNVQANRFIGSGASLTDIPASAVTGLQLDRISTTGVSSGPNLAMVVADQGTISFTLAGNPGRAYLDNTLGLVAPGVSVTGVVSGSSGFFQNGLSVGNIGTGSVIYGGGGWLFMQSRNNGVAILNNNSNPLFFSQSNTRRIGINQNNLLDPSTSVDISGTLRITYSNETCDANRLGAIRYTGNEFSFCRSAVIGWEGLNGIVQGTADRITSGTTQFVVISNTGFISLTQAGTNTGWFDPTRGLVTLGVSATGGISGTSGFFNSLVLGNPANFGTASPFRMRANDATMNLMNEGASAYSGVNMFDNTGNLTGSFQIGGTGTSYANSLFIGARQNGGTLRFVQGVGAQEIARFNSAGMFGISTTTPQTALDVSGTLRIANGNEACDANRLGAIRYTGNEFSFCRSAVVGWESLNGIVQGTADRITSGTTQFVVVSNTGFISLTQAGTNTGWFDPTRGLVTLGVSTTGRADLGGNVSITGVFDAGVGGGLGVQNTLMSLINNGGNQTILRLRRQGLAYNFQYDTSLEANGQNTTLRSGSYTPLFLTAGSGEVNIGGSPTPDMIIRNFSNNPRVGINIALVNPSATLHVSGTARLTSWTMINANATPTAPLEVAGLISATNVTARNSVQAEDLTLGITSGAGGNLILNKDTSGPQGRFRYRTSNAGMGHEFYSSGAGYTFITNGANDPRLMIGGDWGVRQIPSTTLHVSGTLRIANGGEACDANRLGAMRYAGADFEVCRNGTAWETLTSIANNAAGLADRITSGTTQFVVISNTGFISLTQAGTNTGWFDPTRGLVTLGVSTTGPVSTTLVGINNNYIRFDGAANQVQFFTNGSSRAAFNSSGNLAFQNNYGIVWSNNSILGDAAVSTSNIRFSVANTERLRIISSGLVGIGTSTPTTALQVSGTIRMASGGENCDANRLGAIRYAGADFEVCRNGTAWETLSSIASGGSPNWNSIVGIPTNVANVSNGTTLTMQTLSATAVNGLNISGTNGFFPNLSAGAIAANSVSSGLVSATNISGTFAQLRNISTTNISATGNIQANRFIGDGSGLTNLNVQGDRITSGTTSVITNNNTSITFTTAGAERMVIGSNGNVGIGTSTPGSNIGERLSVQGAAYITGDIFAPRFIDQDNSNYFIDPNSTTIAGLFAGRIGIGTLSPSSSLHVFTGEIQTASSGAACAALLAGAIRYTAGSLQFCNNANTWVTLGSAGSADWYGLSNIPTNIANVSNGTTLTMQTLSATAVNGLNISGTNGFFSNLSANAIAANSISSSFISATNISGTFAQLRNISTTNISATGNIQATRFIGDGSQLTGLNVQGDRITSGTTSVVAQNNNAVSITIAGSEVANFNSGGLALTNLNASGAVSITQTAYISGSMGLGMAPSSTQTLSVNVNSTNSGIAVHYQGGVAPVFTIGAGSAGAGALRLPTASSAFSINNNANQAFVRFLSANSSMLVGTGVTTASRTLHVNGGALITSWTGMNFGTGNNVTPSAPLEVSGTISATTLKTGPGETCASSLDAGAIRYTGGALSFCNGSIWVTLGSAGSADWYGLTNVPANITNVSNGTTLTMQTLSATAVNGLNISGTNGFFPNLSANAIAANSVSSSLISATNISGTFAQLRNISTTNISATGNIQATRFIGDGSQLTNLPSASASPTNVPAFSVHRNGSNQTVSSGAWTKINFTTETFDQTNDFDTGNSRFQPTLSGRYLITLNVQCSSATDSCFAGIFKNGAEYASASGSNSNTAGFGSGAVAAVVDLNGTTDFIEGHVYNQNGTVLVGTIARTRMTGSLLASGNGLISGTTPGGVSGSIQFNSGGSTLGGATGLLWDGNTNTVSLTGTLSATNVYGLNISGTNGFFPNLSGNAIAANSISVTQITTTNILSTRISSTNVSASVGDFSVLRVNGVPVGSGGSASPTNVPAFSVHRNGANQTVTTGAWTIIAFTHEDFDVLNSFNTGTSRFTPQVPGRYLITIAADFAGTSAGGYVAIYKNGSLYIGNNADFSIKANLAAIIDMNGSTDYIQAAVFNDAGTILSGAATATRMTGSLLASGNGLISGTTPGGVSGSIQFNNGGSSLGGAAGLLWDGNTNTVSLTGTLSATNVYGLNISGTNGFFPNLSAGAIAANSVSSTNISATNISVTLGQFGRISGTNISASTGDFSTLRINGVAVGAGGADWYGLTNIPTQVQNVSNGTTLTMQTLSATAVNGLNISGTNGFFGNLSAGAIAANSVSSGLISASNISGTLAQLRNVSITNNLTVNGLISTSTGIYAGPFVQLISDTSVCNGTTAGRISYNSGALLYCSGTSWTTLAAGGSTAWGSLTGIPSAITSLSTLTATTGQVLAFNGTTYTGSSTINLAGLTMTGQITGTIITANTLSATNVYGLNISGTNGFFPNLSAGAIAANSVSSSLISATNISGTFAQLRNISGTVGDFTTLRVNGVDIASGLGLTDRIVSGSTSILAGNNTSLTFTTAGTQRMVVGTTGNVGIGLALPSAPLEVAGRISASVVQVARDAGACATAALGSLRLDPATGKLQVCRQ